MLSFLAEVKGALYRVVFYRKENGETPVLDYMRALAKEKSKDSRIKHNKIARYIKILAEKGKQAGEPFMKHLDGEIWELRPLRDRILFAGTVDGCFVLLHSFMKQTQKTPPREIEQAKRELADYLERNEE